jgi:hypothetical protein
MNVEAYTETRWSACRRAGTGRLSKIDDTAPAARPHGERQHLVGLIGLHRLRNRRVHSQQTIPYPDSPAIRFLFLDSSET